MSVESVAQAGYLFAIKVQIQAIQLSRNYIDESVHCFDPITDINIHLPDTFCISNK